MLDTGLMLRHLDALLSPNDRTPSSGVVGSGRGIGFHTARLLARMGATVYITDLSSAAVAAAVAELRDADTGCAAAFLTCDPLLGHYQSGGSRVRGCLVH
jgi:methylase of polypeptide subunit release factors